MDNIFSGRVVRLNYFIASLVVGILMLIVDFIIRMLPLGTVDALLGLAVFLVAIVFSYSLGIRRLHDIGWSGWWSLLLLVPFVNGLFALAILFIPGETAANRYGAVPSGTVDIMATLIPPAASMPVPTAASQASEMPTPPRDTPSQPV